MKTSAHSASQSFLLFVKKIVMVLAIIFILDFLGGSLLSHAYFSQSSGLLYRTTYAMEETRADLLVFGSSRANHHYHPYILEKELGMSYYNVGKDGNFILYHDAILRSVLLRYHPKMIILDISRDELAEDAQAYDRLSALLPYVAKHPEIEPIISLRGTFESIKLISRVYPYNSSLISIIAGNSEFNKSRKEDQQGYIPLFKKWNAPLGQEKPDPQVLDPHKIEMYHHFLSTCQQQHIPLVVICSPSYIQYSAPSSSLQKEKEMAQTLHIPFFDYCNAPDFTQQSVYFSDARHLNDSGAKVFTLDVVKKIKAYPF